MKFSSKTLSLLLNKARKEYKELLEEGWKKIITLSNMRFSS